MVHNKLGENYYSLHDSPGMGAISPNDLNLTSDRDSSIYTLNYRGQLEVKTYMSNSSILNFLFPSVTIDRNGNLLHIFIQLKLMVIGLSKGSPIFYLGIMFILVIKQIHRDFLELIFAS